MKRHFSRSFISGLFFVVVLGIGLALSLFLLISPTQAGRTGLNPAVDPVGTAQAIQTRHRQDQLEAAGQAQKSTWEAEITRLEKTLAESNRGAQIQISQLEAQLITLKAQIKQTEAESQVRQGQIVDLQQAIQAERTQYEEKLASLESQMSQVEEQLQNQLEAASTDLQSAYEQLAGSQVTPSTSDVAGGDDSGDDEKDFEAGSDSEDHGHEADDDQDSEKEKEDDDGHNDD